MGTIKVFIVDNHAMVKGCNNTMHIELSMNDDVNAAIAVDRWGK